MCFILIIKSINEITAGSYLFKRLELNFEKNISAGKFIF